RFAVGREHADADLQPDAQLDAVDRDRLRESLVEAIDQPMCGIAGPVERRHGDREMVGAGARHRVLLTRGAAQPRADGAQEIVARLAAEGLVHHAEALDVEEYRGGEALLAPGGV